MKEKTQRNNQRSCERNTDQAVDSRWKMIFNGRKIEALYLWFVFMNQPDMAKYLCSRSRVRHISYVLFLYHILTIRIKRLLLFSQLKFISKQRRKTMIVLKKLHSKLIEYLYLIYLLMKTEGSIDTRKAS